MEQIGTKANGHRAVLAATNTSQQTESITDRRTALTVIGSTTLIPFVGFSVAPPPITCPIHLKVLEVFGPVGAPQKWMDGLISEAKDCFQSCLICMDDWFGPSNDAEQHKVRRKSAMRRVLGSIETYREHHLSEAKKNGVDPWSVPA